MRVEDFQPISSVISIHYWILIRFVVGQSFKLRIVWTFSKITVQTSQRELVNYGYAFHFELVNSFTQNQNFEWAPLQSTPPKRLPTKIAAKIINRIPGKNAEKYLSLISAWKTSINGAEIAPTIDQFNNSDSDEWIVFFAIKPISVKVIIPIKAQTIKLDNVLTEAGVSIP